MDCTARGEIFVATCSGLWLNVVNMILHFFSHCNFKFKGTGQCSCRKSINESHWGHKEAFTMTSEVGGAERKSGSKEQQGAVPRTKQQTESGQRGTRKRPRRRRKVAATRKPRRKRPRTQAGAQRN